MTQIKNPLKVAIQKEISENDVVALGVLNWGLGHAARCIPIIHHLKERCKKIIICSDSQALELLKLEFPDMEFHSLPPYDMKYKYESMILNILYYFPSLVNAYIRELFVSKSIVKNNGITVMISDNRFAFRSKSTKNIYLSHQITIVHKHSWISNFASKLHSYIINKYDTCWVPDFEGQASLCGKLSVSKNLNNLQYVGPITRINNLELDAVWDICVILSGPEPQRTMLEKVLIEELNKMSELRILFIQGTQKETKYPIEEHIKMLQICDSNQIEQALNTSRLIISRSGYTTLMDISGLNLKAILIPTPGQTEQEYLSHRWNNKKNVRQLSQKDVTNVGHLINALLAEA